MERREITHKTDRILDDSTYRQRVQKIAARPARPRRLLENLSPTTNPNITISPDEDARELFVKLLDGIQRYETVLSSPAARKVHANFLLVADYLTDGYSGDDRAARFQIESFAYLQEANPRLYKNVKKVLEDSEERGEKRAALRREFNLKYQNR